MIYPSAVFAPAYTVVYWRREFLCLLTLLLLLLLLIVGWTEPMTMSLLALLINCSFSVSNSSSFQHLKKVLLYYVVFRAPLRDDETYLLLEIKYQTNYKFKNTTKEYLLRTKIIETIAKLIQFCSNNFFWGDSDYKMIFLFSNSMQTNNKKIFSIGTLRLYYCLNILLTNLMEFNTTPFE